MNRHNACRRGLIAALLMNSAVSIAEAQSVAVTVDADDVVRAVDERVFGINTVMWDPEASSDETIELVREAGIRAVRIPGGSLSNLYRWHKNVTYSVEGGVDNAWTWATGFDGFARLITGAETQAFVAVNYGTGTPEMAAAWIAYANAAATILGTPSDVAIGMDQYGIDWQTAGYWSSLRAATSITPDDGQNFLRIGRTAPIGIRHWEIGNENYGSWEADIQATRHDPHTYATRSRDYIELMKQVDPSIQVGVVVERAGFYPNQTPQQVTNPRTGQATNAWTDVVLHTLDSLNTTPDFLIYHRYDIAPGTESDAQLLQSARTIADDAENLRQLADDYLGAQAENVELVITEMNSVYTDPGKQSTSLVNGLFLADSVGNLLQTEFNAMTWWDLRNSPPRDGAGNLVGNLSPDLYGWRQYGDYGVLSTPSDGLATSYYEAYPTYYAMKLLSYFARGGDTVVSATSDNTLLAMFSVRRADGSLALLAINKSPSGTFTADIALSNFTPPAQANVYAYGIPNDNAARPDQGGCADITGSTLNIAGAAFSLPLAPYSATVIALGGTPVALVESEPTIAAQPAAISVTAGQSTTLATRAKGCPAPAYRWQRMAAGGSTWEDLSDGGAYSGTATETLTVSSTTAAMNGDQFRSVAANAAGSITGDAATMTVTAAAPPPPPQPPSSGGSGGGGGAWSYLLIATLISMLGIRRRLVRSQTCRGGPHAGRRPAVVGGKDYRRGGLPLSSGRPHGEPEGSVPTTTVRSIYSISYNLI